MKWKSLLAVACFAVLLHVPCLAQEDAPEPAVADDDADDAPLMAGVLPAGQNSAHEPTAAQRNRKTAAATLELAQNGKALVPIIIATDDGF